ncbi:MAG: site-specific DNA-methyltransferase [Nitrospirae bacterium]|nr:site-specific DNA-methyltransferase [Nitrospirota bacterium]
MPKKKDDNISNIESVKHKDKRKNIPTEELRDFVKDDEKSPKNVLYPRDTSLDPQLVWKGKDEQDSMDLSVPCVPIYIQEKIHTQAIVEDIKSYAAKDKPEDSPQLFSDFNGIKFEDMIEFYQHEQNWSNRMILGDSLQVMTSLAEKEGLKGKVQTIYLDPPYGIKFGSNWQVSTRKKDVKDGKTEDVTRQPEQVKAFRDTWVLGIHSYLSYLRDRLVVARELLTETGSCFVQIGDENVHLVRCLMDEVFGSENFVSLITFQKTSAQTTELLPPISDYLIWYAKERKGVKYRQLYVSREPGDDADYRGIEFPDGTRRMFSLEEAVSLFKEKRGKLFRYDQVTSQTGGESSSLDFQLNGKIYRPQGSRGWSTTEDGLLKLAKLGRIVGRDTAIAYIRYHEDYPVMPVRNIWNNVALSSRAEEKYYVVQTSIKVIQLCCLMTTDPGDIVLDPTCGSGTTAYVAEQWGRRWITIDTSRVALALARTRLMSARYPFYYLADTEEGIKKEAEVSGKGLSWEIPQTDGDIKKGFVYKRVPHITLKSIANNPDIKEGMSREEIDAAISRHAEIEVLYDQPYEDKKRIRVAGPFTVESLSPHRVIKTQDEYPISETIGRRADSNGQFANLIIENLKKAGVQNTKVQERLKFDRLEPYAGVWIHASGEYTENDKIKRAAVTIGPEHGTVGPELVKEAAKEAVKGVGFDLLIVCGFAFDPHVSEEIKRYGNLTILPTRMNPDMTIGDELLKKTGKGNLFMVFGEPDMDIKNENGQITVKINGLDIYDPTTGEIRSNSTDDIACWFIDTNYNGESFFVRHAYFTGADKPYEKLKKALRAEIDEAAWSSIYSTESRPFDKPETGKIAVKVINHYGDEVLKVYDIL